MVKKILLIVMFGTGFFNGQSQTRKEYQTFIENIARYLEIDNKLDKGEVKQLTNWIVDGENVKNLKKKRIENWQNFFTLIYEKLEDPNTYKKGSMPFTATSALSGATTLKYFDGSMKFEEKLGGVNKKGNGSEIMVLIAPPGFDGSIYDNLINEFQSKFTIYSITLPGFGGSEPLPIPEKRKFSDLKWSAQVEQLIHDYLVSEGAKNITFLGTL